MASKLDRSTEFDSVINSAAQRLGYRHVKPEQLKVVVSFLKGNDVFAVLPTGYGKTLCYTILPIAFDLLQGTEGSSGAIVVVTPLVAIIQDQVAKLLSKGIRAVDVSGHGSSSYCDDVATGRYQIVFFSPEMICNRTWRKMLTNETYSVRLKAVVIDEAHCVAKWRETFRSSFMRLIEVRSSISSAVNLMALTATAGSKLRQRVIHLLGMHNPQLIYVSPSKPNIMYFVKDFESIETTFEKVATAIKIQRESLNRTIIYCRQYRECYNLYMYFKKQLKEAFTSPIGAPDVAQYRLIDMYVSCTDETTKTVIVDRFTRPSNLRIVISTVAFGMGIDCEVYHMSPPEDVEAYIQETGRAGRNGELAYAILLKTTAWKRFVNDELMVSYIENTEKCRREHLFREMETDNTVRPKGCLCCDLCHRSCTCKQCQVLPTVLQ